MYNNDQREEFINTISTHNKKMSARKAFDKVEKFERKAQRDIATFSTDEVKKVYRDLHEYKAETLYRINHYFSWYADWCIEHHIPGITENVFEKIVGEDIIQCAAKDELISYQQLREWSIKVVSYSYVNAFILVAPFFGFSHKNEFAEYAAITRSDIEIKKGEAVFHLPTRELTTPVYVGEYAIKATEEEEYYAPGDGIVTLMKYMPSDHVVKFVMRKSFEPQNMKYLIPSKFSRTFKIMFDDDTLTVKKMERSGMAYYAQKIMSKYNKWKVYEVYDTPEFQREVLDRFCLRKTTHQYYVFTGILENNIAGNKRP